MKCACPNCDREAKTRGYCRKHYYHLRVHGSVPTYSLSDFNEVVDKGRYLELVLLNNSSEEIGRCKIDREDLDKVNMCRWGLKSDGYVVNAKYGPIHRIITKAKEKEQVDHIKVGVKYRSDNRKKNLRVCNNSQNQHNKTKTIRNTSGYKNVSWDRKAEKWKAAFEYDKKSIYVGLFECPKKAYKAYCEKAKELLGDYFRG